MRGRIPLLSITVLSLALLPRAARPPVSSPCEERPRTPIPQTFPTPRMLGAPGHTNVTSVALGSLDGRPVAVSTGQEGSTRVWALPGLTPLPDAGPVTVPTRTPPVTRIHGRAVRVTADDEIHLTDVATGRPTGPRISLGDVNTVNGLEVLTLDGHPTAVINDDGGMDDEVSAFTLKFRDLVTGRVLTSIDGDFAAVRQARVNGRTVLITANNPPNDDVTVRPPAGSISLWDPLTRTQVAQLPGHPPPPGTDNHYNPYTRVALDVGLLDGRPVALTGGGDNTVRLWDLTTARQIAATEPPGHTDEITGIATGPGYAVTTGWDGQVITWDLATGRRLAAGSGGGPKYGAAIGRFGERPAVVTLERELLRAWALPALTPLGPGRTMPPDGRLDVLGGQIVLLDDDYDGKRIRLLDARTGAQIGRTVQGAGRLIDVRRRVLLLDGHPTLVELGPRSRLWDLTTPGSPRSVRGVSDRRTADPVTGWFRCTTAMLVTRGFSLRAWDPRTLRPLGPPMRGHRSTITGIVYGTLGDRPIAVTNSHDRTIRVWDLTTASQIGPALPAGRRAMPIDLGYSGGHTYLLAGGSDERLRSWTLH